MVATQPPGFAVGDTITVTGHIGAAGAGPQDIYGQIGTVTAVPGTDPGAARRLHAVNIPALHIKTYLDPTEMERRG